MCRTDNPLRDFDRYEAEQELLLKQLPHCADFDEPIQDETAYYINGEWICRDCMCAYEQVVLPE